MDYQGEQLRCLLALLRLPELNESKLTNLLKDCSDLTSLFDPQGNCKVAPGTLDWSGVDKDLAWAEQPACRLLTMADVGYPQLLKEIDTSPPVLFVRGDVKLLSTMQIAIVGSRHPSRSGVENASDFAEYFSTRGLTITSGLALGIDGAAHRGALRGTGRTVAVMGNGLDGIYPRRHQRLADQIVEQGGVLVSEFSVGIGPKPEHFPRRNRIISGLSVGTLVVEAALKSGSLITARLALEQGREVFAIPGSIHNPLAKGPHALIQQGAKLVETALDVFEELKCFVRSAAFEQEEPIH